MQQYQVNMQQHLANMQQYQATMHQSFQNYWALQYPTNAFAYQPVPPPNLVNPPPIHWHRPTIQTDATVITPSTPTEETSQMPRSKKRITPKERLTTIQQAQSSILNYSPKAQADVAKSTHTPELTTAQAGALTSTPTPELHMAKADALTWTPPSKFKALESPAPKLPTAQAGALTSIPTAEFPTVQADTTTLENISQDFEHVLLSEPNSHWTIHDTPIGLSR